MLRRVPPIASLDVEHDPHPRVWAIVLTGDAHPVAGRAHRAAARTRRWRSTCASAAPGTRAGEAVARPVPASRVVTVTTRGRIAPLATERPELLHVHRVVQPHYRGRAA